jgi:hypothetical protein
MCVRPLFEEQRGFRFVVKLNDNLDKPYINDQLTSGWG